LFFVPVVFSMIHGRLEAGAAMQADMPQEIYSGT
jgi:hypothetical protein